MHAFLYARSANLESCIVRIYVNPFVSSALYEPTCLRDAITQKHTVCHISSLEDLSSLALYIISDLYSIRVAAVAADITFPLLCRKAQRETLSP